MTNWKVLGCGEKHRNIFSTDMSSALETSNTKIANVIIKEIQMSTHAVVPRRVVHARLHATPSDHHHPRDGRH